MRVFASRAREVSLAKISTRQDTPSPHDDLKVVVLKLKGDASGRQTQQRIGITTGQAAIAPNSLCRGMSMLLGLRDLLDLATKQRQTLICGTVGSWGCGPVAGQSRTTPRRPWPFPPLGTADQPVSLVMFHKTRLSAGGKTRRDEGNSWSPGVVMAPRTSGGCSGAEGPSDRALLERIIIRLLWIAAQCSDPVIARELRQIADELAEVVEGRGAADGDSL